MFSRIKLYYIIILVFSVSFFHIQAHSIEIKDIKYLQAQYLTIQFGKLYTHWFSNLWEIIDTTGETFYGVPAIEAEHIGITAIPDSHSLEAAIQTTRPIFLLDLSPVEKQTIQVLFPISTDSQYPNSLEIAYNLALKTLDLVIFKVYDRRLFLNLSG